MASIRSSDRIYVAGHTGLVGSAVFRSLQRRGYKAIISKSHGELDLRRQTDVEDLFRDERPDHVFLCAALVGGIHANNTRRGEFISDNLMIQSNVLNAALRYRVRRLLFLGSSCVYPRDCPQPIREEYLLSGPLERTNEPYAIAKIAGIKTCEAFNDQFGTHFVPVMPTNLYGIHDNFDAEGAHVLPGLIRRFHEAKQDGRSEVIVWGSGSPRREFLYADDLADACIDLLASDTSPHLTNIGSGEEVTIRELAHLVAETVGFKGILVFDRSRPDGTPRKLLDSTRIRATGWRPRVSLEEGVSRVYEWYRGRSGVPAMPDRDVSVRSR